MRHFLDLYRNILPPMNAYSQNNDMKFTAKFKEAISSLNSSQEMLKKAELSWNLGLHSESSDDGRFKFKRI